MKQIGSAALRQKPALPIIAFLLVASAHGQTGSLYSDARVPVEEIFLDNGMRLLLVPRPNSTTVAAGWMVETGSANDSPDHTGMSHLLEHLLFKGTRQVGTRQADRELELLDEIDRLWAAEQDLTQELESSSAKKRQKLMRRLAELSAQRQATQQDATRLELLGEFSYLYSEQGGVGLNANTYRDMTVYYVTLPSEKLEIWFWLESNRLMEPVFRQFYKEIGVIEEERRLRIESTPTGVLDEQLRGRFWGYDHPYSWDPMGTPRHLDSISRGDAREFFIRHYRPDKLTAALVGGFDPVQAKAWARRYFGRLSGEHTESSSVLQPPVIPKSTEPQVGSCNCPSQVRAVYPSAAFGNDDIYALQLLSAILNGRTGRLYRDLVLERGIAFAAFTQQVSWRRAGEFSFQAESKGEFQPTTMLSAWEDQVRALQTENVPQEEIRRAMNRLTADAFRVLKDPTALMKQLLIYQGLGDWRYVNRWSRRVRAVSADDLRQVAVKYLAPEARTVAIYQGSARAMRTAGSRAPEVAQDATE